MHITLPRPDELKRHMQSLAALDALVSPEWEYRYYSFDAHWGEDECMGSIRNGSGDTVFVLFNTDGSNKENAFLKGFAHEFTENLPSPEAFYKDVPQAFIGAKNEPAFSPDHVSYCLWHMGADKNWQSAVSPTKLDPKSFFLIEELDGKPQTYLDFAKEYYEAALDLSLITAIYNHEPITEKMAVALNPEADWAVLCEDLEEIKYPYTQSVHTQNGAPQ